jgi:quinoprotein glucose dehydrogenase
VVAFRLPRQGEAPSLWSRTVDRPGGRFLSKAIMLALVIALMVVAVWRWRRRAKLRRTGTNTRQSDVARNRRA